VSLGCTAFSKDMLTWKNIEFKSSSVIVNFKTPNSKKLAAKTFLNFKDTVVAL
jgi:hypothetical protein